MHQFHIAPKAVLAAFPFPGEIVDASRYGEGHINDTFAVTCRVDNSAESTPRRFILQRINRFVFKNPIQVMENILGVTRHIEDTFLRSGGGVSGAVNGAEAGDRTETGNSHRECLRVLPTLSGEFWHIDEAGDTWRLYNFIEQAVSFQRVETPELFAASARAFGQFAGLLQDYPVHLLHDTIPHFHDTPLRFSAFLEAVESAEPSLRESCREEIRFVLERKEDCQYLEREKAAGRLPLRVTHNDTKLNNVMIDPDRLEPVCVIDLDTVMPGLWAYDFGDAIRFGASTAAEDERDLSLVSLDLDLYHTYRRAFLETAGTAITAAEIESLPWGARLMTLECGMRFLTDYLQGDLYFKIHRPQHNLDRCRAQFRLLQDMEKKWEQMVSFT